MKYITGIDRLKIQIDFDNEQQQKDVQAELYSQIVKTKRYSIKDVSNPKNTAIIYNIYSNKTQIATIYSSLNYVHKTSKKTALLSYYTSIEFAGLKTHNKKIDKLSNALLHIVCAYLNHYSIAFKITGLDICIDIESPLENILAVCTKKSPRTEYYTLNDKQVYDTTRYIEKIAPKSLNKCVLRSYYYCKSCKENLQKTITRYELKLQTRYFRRYGFSKETLDKALSRYHIMYFKDIDKKDSIIDAYTNYKYVKQREIKKLNLAKYRIHADVEYLTRFLNSLFTVQVSDLISIVPKRQSDIF